MVYVQDMLDNQIIETVINVTRRKLFENVKDSILYLQDYLCILSLREKWKE